MTSYTQSIQNLINELASLPGIGLRSAERIAFHLLKSKTEDAMKLSALESTGLYNGVYHVLLGRIAPLEGIEPADVTVEPLMQRLASGTIREVVMGTNPNMEGDGTALHIQNLIASRFPNVQITRLARGLPAGSNIEYANRNILADAIAGRQKM